MKYIPLFAQISALTMAAISKRPDAMGYAAIFAVLCVVAVVFKHVFGATGSTRSRSNG